MHFENTKDLADWLIQVLSEETDLRPEDINPNFSFAALGIDSVESVSLACRLDEVFDGFTVKPELFWEVDNINELAQELFDRTGAARFSQARVSPASLGSEPPSEGILGN